MNRQVLFRPTAERELLEAERRFHRLVGIEEVHVLTVHHASQIFPTEL
jgi:hypothetical protein